MSRLILVRHGQASAHARDYDQLSTLGVDQSRRLGADWAAHGLACDAIYVGPRKRHAQTEEALRAAAKEGGLDLPPAEPHEGLDEIDVSAITKQAMERVSPMHPDFKTELASGELSDLGQTVRKHFAGIVDNLLRRWIRGDDVDGVLPFDDFERRVRSALHGIMRAQGAGKRVVLITSGGPIMVALKLCLSVDPERTCDLMMGHHNAALTELLYSKNKLTLAAYNHAPHLRSPELLTKL